MLKLIQAKNFYPTFWTQFFGAFNDNVYKNALVILITFKSFSLAGISTELMVTACAGIFILPFFLFSAFAGQVCDSYSKSQLTVAIKFAEVIIMILGAIGFFSENLSLLLFVLFLMGTQSTFYGPVKYSILPELVSDKNLTKANAAIEMGTFLAILLGTILGGGLIGFSSFGVGITAILVVCFALIGLFFSSKIPKLKKGSSEKISYNFIKQNKEIISLCRSNKTIWFAVLVISWFWFIGSILLSVFPVYVSQHLAKGEFIATLFLACFSIGIAFGSYICERLSREHAEKGVLTFGAFGISLFCFDLYFASHSILSTEFGLNLASLRILIDLVMISVSAGLFIVPLYTSLQTESATSERSRVIAGNNIINAFFMVIGSLGLGLFYSIGFKTYDVYLVLALTNLLVSYIVYRKYSQHFWRLVCQLSAHFFYKFSFKGQENIPKEGAVILICNHVTYIDWLFIAGASKRNPRFVMWYVFFKMPIIDIFFKGAKAIPIAGVKEDKAVLDTAFVKISEELRADKCVAYFPEGVICKQEQMSYFRAGLEKIIKEDDVKLVPMYLDGLWGSFFSRKRGKACSSVKDFFKEFRREVTLNIGEPFPFSSLNESEERVLALKK